MKRLAKKITIHRQFKNKRFYRHTFLVIAMLCLFFASSKIYNKYYNNNSEIFHLPNNITKRTIVTKQGDNLFSILAPYNLTYEEVKKIVLSSKPFYDLKHINVGKKWNIYSVPQKNKNKLFRIEILLSKSNKLVIQEDDLGEFFSEMVEIPFKKKLVRYKGQINSSFLNAAKSQAIPYQNIIEIINAHSYNIDFQRDVKKGDKFEIILEKSTDISDPNNFYYNTIFSSLHLSGKKHNIYSILTKNGNREFVNDQNRTVRTSLLKKPVQATRISSRFGMRKHPVLGYSRMHKGVDFAAPSGTPIYAAGNGIIVSKGWKGGYGRYIKIKHNQRISTAYGHLSSYARGLHKGQKVTQGQIIGRVGTSGRATGPHLHYEVHINNKHVNPLSIKSASDRSLTKKEIESLRKLKNKIEKINYEQ